VGGLHPSLPYSYYLDLLTALKNRFPGIHLKAWTMVEIDWFARVGKKSVEEVIDDLKSAGLDSCPGGGAEIFAKRVRDIICTDKISGERFLEVSRLCHERGLKTNVTMLRTPRRRGGSTVSWDHELQDETNGFASCRLHPDEPSPAPTRRLHGFGSSPWRASCSTPRPSSYWIESANLRLQLLPATSSAR
jgi:aminodeoxyfutalosine synthase